MNSTNYDIKTKDGLANSVRWLNAHLARISNGGTWMIPRSCTAYIINHDRKIAVKTIAMYRDDVLDIVFKAAGWTVKDANE